MNKLLLTCYTLLFVGILMLFGCSIKKVSPANELPSSVGSGKNITTGSVLDRESLRGISEPSTVMIGTTRQQNLPGKPTQFLEDQINRIGWGISIDTGKSLTVSHLFDDSEALYVLLNGRDGTIVSIKNIRKNENDLAIISVDYGLTPYQRIATESDISIGDTVLADDGNAYQGEVLDLVDNQIITTLELVPGKSGLPLFDEQGVLIGINSSITEKDGEIVTYAQSITTSSLAELLSGSN